jgi:hypothetical protein
MEASDVYGLIHRMSPSERRYFRIHSGYEEDPPRYLRLYTFILTHQIHSDDALRQHPDSKDFHEGRNLSMEKKRLQNHLLSALVDFDKTSNPSITRFQLLCEVEALEARGYVELAAEQLAVVKAKAEKVDAWSVLLEVNALENRFARLRQSPTTSTQLAALRSERDAYVQNITLELRSKDLWDALLQLVRSGKTLPGTLETLLAELVDLRTLSVQHFTFRLHLAMSDALVALLQGRDVEAYQHYRGAIQMLASNPHLASENPRSILLHYYNYLNLAHAVRDYSEFPAHLAYIETLEKEIAKRRPSALPYASTLRLIYLANTGQIAEALKVAQALYTRHAQPTADIPNSYIIANAFNLIILQFLNGDYSALKKTIVTVITDRHLRLREELRAMLLVVEALAYFEAEDWDLLDARCRALERRKWQSEVLKMAVVALIGCLRKYMQVAHTRDARSEALQHCLATISQLRERFPALQVQGWNEVYLYFVAKSDGVTIASRLQGSQDFNYSPLPASAVLMAGEEEADV